MATNTGTKSKENDDTRLVFSNLTFTVTAAPTTAQDYLTSAATVMAIPEDLTNKSSFSDADDQLQVSAASAPCSMLHG